MDHGIDTSNVHFQRWIVLVPSMYFGFLILFRILNVWDFKTRGGARASDIMAFQIVAGFCVVWLTAVGFIGQFNLFGVNEYAKLLANPWWGRSEFIENYLLYPMISYQGWNLLLCFFSKDLGDPAMIGHHLVTGTLAYFMLHPYAQYQCFFFSGMVELSNIPLTLMDVFKYFPNLANAYPTLNSLSRTLFGITFIVLRLLIWPVLSYHFDKGSLELVTSGKSHSNFVVLFFVVSNIFLTGLQFFWGSKIINILLFKQSKPKKGKE